MLTQADIRELLHYDPETGVLTWRDRDRRWFETDRAYSTWNTRYAGKQAGSMDDRGCIKVMLFYRLDRAHRLAWVYMTGEWPPDQIDHIDRDPSNNRWANLRLANTAENGRNRPAQANNTSGYKGVFRKGKKWRAQIAVEGKPIHLGMFLTPEGASLAYRWAAERYHREFARHG